MLLRRIMPLLISLTLASGVITYAQEPQAQAQDDVRRGDGRRNRESRSQDLTGKDSRHKPGDFGGVRELNLTDQQRQLQQSIYQRHLESVKAQREELIGLRAKRLEGNFTAEDRARAQTLRQEIHNSMLAVHNEIELILTPEQRAKLEQIKNERKARRAERQKRRPERRENIPQ